MGKIIENGIVVSVGNQKGGVGKSVITSFIANYIHQTKQQTGLEIAVIDGDDLQGSLINLRNEELKENPSDNYYRLVQISSIDIPSQIDLLKEEFDIIFIDLPGNLKQDGVLNCYLLVDVIFIPTQTSQLDLQSTFDFVKLYKNEIVSLRDEEGEKTKIFGFFNRVRTQNKEFKFFQDEQTKANLPIEFMENSIPDAPAIFQRNVSTVNVYKNNKYNDYQDFAEEMIDKIASVRIED